MRPFLFVLIALLTSCGEKRSSGIRVGVTTATELLQEKGEPLSTTDIPKSEGQVLTYSNDEKFQINDDIVTGHFKDPVGDESLLIYWKHKFKDHPTALVEIPSKKESHGPKEYFLKCDSLKLGVIYREGSARISRMVEYEK